MCCAGIVSGLILWGSESCAGRDGEFYVSDVANRVLGWDGYGRGGGGVWVLGMG